MQVMDKMLCLVGPIKCIIQFLHFPVEADKKHKPLCNAPIKKNISYSCHGFVQCIDTNSVLNDKFSYQKHSVWFPYIPFMAVLDSIPYSATHVALDETSVFTYFIGIISDTPCDNIMVALISHAHLSLILCLNPQGIYKMEALIYKCTTI